MLFRKQYPKAGESVDSKCHSILQNHHNRHMIQQNEEFQLDTVVAFADEEYQHAPQ